MVSYNKKKHVNLKFEYQVWIVILYENVFYGLLLYPGPWYCNICNELEDAREKTFEDAETKEEVKDEDEKENDENEVQQWS